jgi:DNA-binding Xre family transcriptional regulator
MARWRLREIAEAKGLNAHKLALEAKLSYNTVHPIWMNKAKRADLETLAKLAQALGVAPGQLIGNGEDQADARNINVPGLVAA